MAARPAPSKIAVGRRLVGSLQSFCLALALFCPASAASAPYHFKSYTTENGLSADCIQAMRQTRDGYLWLSTAEGLLRFDGVHFRAFQSSNTPALKVNGFFPSALLEDRQGGLWAGTFAGGVIRHYQGVFTAYTTKEGLPSNTVFRVDEDPEGTIWIFTTAGLARWKDGQLTRIGGQPGSGFDLGPPLGHIAPRNYLGLWRMGATGWERFAYGRWSRLPLAPEVTDPLKVRMDTMIEDSSRRLWYQVSDRPGEHYCVSQGRLEHFTGLPRPARVFYQDQQGYLWLAGDQDQVALWKDGLTQPLEGLRAPLSYVLADRDREGGLWLGTCGAGLYHLIPEVITVHRQDGRPEGNNIHTLMRARDGTIWFGTSDGLSRLINGKFEKPLRLGARSAPENVVIALYEDRDGQIWIGTNDGLARFSKGALRKVGSRLAKIHGLVHVIYRDRAGDLWIGGDEGLYRFRGGELRRYSKADGLGGDNVKTILEDRTGALWIGTEEGLGRIENGTISSWTDANGWIAAEVASMYEDAAGVLWFGSFDKGLSRVENGKLTHITTAQGLFSNTIFHIQEDDGGFLWMSSRRGLFRVSKQELNDFAAGRTSFVASTRFGKVDGLVHLDCTSEGQPGGFKAPDGKLWFRTQGGIGSIDPKVVPLNQNPPPVVIEECLLDRHPVPFQNGLTLRPGQSDLEIHYTALSLIRSADIRFKYRLEGLDRDWVEAGTRRTAYYPHLEPGTYLFKVIAANGDGVWNTGGTSLVVNVLPPFYRTWWFLTLSFICAAGLVSSAWRFRVSQLKRSEAVQQAFTRQLISSQESERKRIAAELHDSLGQQLLIIKNWAVLTLSELRGHDTALKAPLVEISTTASQAIDEVRGIAYNLRPYQLEKLGLTTAIEDLVDQVAASSAIRFIAELDGVDGVFTKEVELSIYRIVQEGLNNIIRHSQATEAGVLVAHRAGLVELTIEDNGRGFTPPDGHLPEQGRKGFGLLGIAERVRMLGGQVTIRSAPGGGSRINISLRVQQPAS